ncbi:uncharacterized protein YbjT (DUF2867 family) [Microbacterium sp. AG1240]|uniref:NmrA family NAD(P)-binding protein n=1 Tax=Microbacterium sp. AG1240 TaxID=2183992 RepID=UPI000EB4AD04|nr:NmrA family NAD(P)-binding protein [Microbacterium sp. AG1240]RKT37141.1 uncharacterized protein YbjT (DUF2867 family) [Microbacterium sp. AG1240]
MIIVTGASGNLGSRIVERLLTVVPAAELGVSVRDATRARALADRGVRVREADFTAPASLGYSMEGADQVLVVSAEIRGDAAVVANTAAIDAAVAAGASHVLYTSHQAASADSLFPPQVVHAAAEAHLARAGVPFTALRNGFYAASLDVHLAAALATGQIVVPPDGPVSWTAHDDLAEAAVIALTRPGAFAGITPPLTAGVALDLGDVAGLLSRLTGRSIVRVTVSDEEWRTASIARGLPPAVVDFSLGLFRASRQGEFDVVSPALAHALCRAPQGVEETLRRLLGDRGIAVA